MCIRLRGSATFQLAFGFRLCYAANKPPADTEEYYKLLGVDKGADEGAIRKAFLKVWSLLRKSRPTPPLCRAVGDSASDCSLASPRADIGIAAARFFCVRCSSRRCTTPTREEIPRRCVPCLHFRRLDACIFTPGRRAAARLGGSSACLATTTAFSIAIATALALSLDGCAVQEAEQSRGGVV